MPNTHTHTKIFWVLIFTIFFTPGFAQITADFSSNNTIGCSPFLVTFNDISTGSNITFRAWNFGNGNQSVGNTTQPSVIYTLSGYYDVTLTISNGVDTSSVTKLAYIHATDKPMANMTLSTASGCAPLQVNFTDISSTVGSPIVSRAWYYDDGSMIDTAQNVTHIFNDSGHYHVSLIVTDSLGCASSVNSTNTVHVFKPVASFIPLSSTTTCNPPLAVDLKNTSTGAGTLTSVWNVNALSFTTNDLNTNINVSGSYDVTLTVSDSLGCMDTLIESNYLNAGVVTASMIIPDTTCRNLATTFLATTTGSATHFWDFGDAQSATGDSVSHAYLYPGSFTVTLVATLPGGCTDTTRQTIIVESIIVDFSSSPSFSCSAPMVVSFQDHSIGNIVSWKWNFGSSSVRGGNTSNAQNPNRTINDPGIYNDTLTVTTAFGCSRTVVHVANDSLMITQAGFVPDLSEGCAPLAVNFSNTSIPFDSVSTVSWDFGDGTIITGLNVLPVVSHVFMKAGEYDVELTVTSFSGCSTTYTEEIKVGTQQSSSFVLDTNWACASRIVSFYNTSTSNVLIDNYEWNFGDGSASGAYQPQHLFRDTGYLHVSLIVGYNGCFDTAVVDSAIYIQGPIVFWDKEVDCDTPNIVTFEPTNIGGTDFWWNFDDGSPIDSTSSVVDHTFPINDGDYHVIYYAKDTNSGCSYSNSRIMRVRYLEANMTATDSVICRKDTVEFDASSSVNNYGFTKWALNNWNNIDSANAVRVFKFNNRGTSNVYAIVYDINGCADTLQQSIEVHQPIANITVDTAIGCTPLQVEFTDASSSDTNIVSWAWDFGDGATSTIQNPIHSFSSQRNTYFDVRLQVTDTFGCTHTRLETNLIQTQKPRAFFKTFDRAICAADTVYFERTPLSSGYSYDWNFGDGTSGNRPNPKHAYQTGGVYTIDLTVTNALGCDSTFSRQGYVTVHDLPDANFNADKMFSSCYPVSVVFTDSNTSSNSVVWEWNYGDSSSTAITNSGISQKLYTSPGQFEVTLRVESSNGCADSVTKSNFINVLGPTADMVVNPTSGCAGEEVLFSVTNNNAAATKFSWDLGDGVVESFNGQFPRLKHEYLNEGTYGITLMFSDSSGTCVKTEQKDLFIGNVEADFNLSHAFSCAPLNLSVVNQSSGYNLQQWYINGIPKSALTNPQFTIQSPGDHLLQLVTWNDSISCRDTASQTVTVHPIPEVEISSDSIVCIGNDIELNANGAVDYHWFPAMYLDNALIQNPVATLSSNMEYVVQGTDANNCINYDTVKLYVINAPEITNFPSDTVIFFGEEINIDIQSDQDLAYNWTSESFLSCDDCQQFYASPLTTTTYNLNYGDEYGCFSNDTSFVINVHDFRVFIPNAFSPNNDGMNDVFIAETDGVEKLIYMQVYDSWGGLVFETSDLETGWDGLQNGEKVNANSNFVYKIRVAGYNGATAEFIGEVTVISR